VRALAQVSLPQAPLGELQKEKVQTVQLSAAGAATSAPYLVVGGYDSIFTSSPERLCDPESSGADRRERTRTRTLETDGVPHGPIRRIGLTARSKEGLGFSPLAARVHRANSDVALRERLRLLVGSVWLFQGRYSETPEIAFAGDLGVSGYSGPRQHERTPARYAVRPHRDILIEARTSHSGLSVRILQNNGDPSLKNVLLPELSTSRESLLLRSSSDGATGQCALPITKDALARLPFLRARRSQTVGVESIARQVAAKESWRRSQ